MNASTNASETFAHSEGDLIRVQEARLTPAQRWLSLAEFLLGSAIVIAHNVYHIIPNEVPILFCARPDFAAAAGRRLGRNGPAVARLLAASCFARARGSDSCHQPRVRQSTRLKHE